MSHQNRTRKQNDEYALYSLKRQRTMKIVTWVAIIGLLVTTAITFGVVGFTGS